MKTTHTYIQFKFLSGTQTRKVMERADPPKTKPQNSIEYRYFNLDENIPEHLANQYKEKDMLNISKWKKIEQDKVKS